MKKNRSRKSRDTVPLRVGLFQGRGHMYTALMYTCTMEESSTGKESKRDKGACYLYVYLRMCR
jgi:hypothetical protein